MKRTLNKKTTAISQQLREEWESARAECIHLEKLLSCDESSMTAVQEQWDATRAVCATFESFITNGDIVATVSSQAGYPAYAVTSVKVPSKGRKWLDEHRDTEWKRMCDIKCFWVVMTGGKSIEW
jgi:hypothetical protein